MKYYEFNVEENYPIRQSFGKVRAIDKDLGESGRVSYSIEESENDIFEINKLSGELSTKVNLDRELKSSYLLKVVATDHGQNQQLSNR